MKFYLAPEKAEAAGFRACRRCRPRDAQTAVERTVAKARAYLEAGAGRSIGLEELACAVEMSPAHLQRSFKRIVGVSPKRYHAALRAEQFKSRLRAGDTVSRATYEAGYGAASRAYDASAEQLGMTPAAYRAGGRGVRIRYAITGTRLGRVLVAATERGVCAVTFGETDAQLERALADEYPEASRIRVPSGAAQLPSDLRSWVTAIKAHVNGAGIAPALPTDVGGTPFQRRVWGALQAIPCGATRTYSEVAASLGMSRAVRAVASACARNQAALVIPCHRVVRTDGGLGGYRWGLDRKRRLLATEHAFLARRIGGAA